VKNGLTDSLNIAVVCHTPAGNGKSATVLKEVLQKIESLAISHQVFTINWPDNFDGFTAVWLIGGDGTLNYFINRYPHINIPVALFKGGSGNDFAWKLYKNKSVDQYLETVLHGKPSPVDLGICNGRYFINGVGIGFDGEVVKAMGSKRFLPGHLAYLWTVIKKILFYKEKEVEISIENSIKKEKIFMISIANGSRYGGGFLIAPHAVLNDGELDIIIIKPIRAWKRFFYLPLVEKGKHTALSFAECTREKQIRIESTSVLDAHLDGELMEGNIFDIEIVKGNILFVY